MIYKNVNSTFTNALKRKMKKPREFGQCWKDIDFYFQAMQTF